MTILLAATLAVALGAELVVEAGAPLGEALARARPGDTLRLGPGVHRGSLGRPAGLRIEGAGAGLTVISPPEGEDGVVAAGPLRLAGLSIVAGPNRAALKVLGGAVELADVALQGGSCGAFVDEGRLAGRDVWLAGDYGLLSRRGEVALRGVTATGRRAAVALLGGTLRLSRAALTGPGSEAGLSVAGGRAEVSETVVRDPGPSGVAVAGGELVARDLAVAGPRERRGALGDCLQLRRGTARLAASELVSCGGAAVGAWQSTLALDGVDAVGGEAGCLVLAERSRADLAATLCTRHGPGLVAMEGSTARAFGARFWTDPALWVDCGSGARVELLGEPAERQPCRSPP